MYAYGYVPENDVDCKYCQLKGFPSDALFKVTSLDREKGKVTVEGQLSGMRPTRSLNGIRFCSQSQMIAYKQMARKTHSLLVQAKKFTDHLVIEKKESFTEMMIYLREVHYKDKVCFSVSAQLEIGSITTYPMPTNIIYESIESAKEAFASILSIENPDRGSVCEKLAQLMFDIEPGDEMLFKNPLEHDELIKIRVIGIFHGGADYVKLNKNGKPSKTVYSIPQLMLSALSEEEPIIEIDEKLSETIIVSAVSDENNHPF